MKFKLNINNGELNSIYILGKETAFFRSLKNINKIELAELKNILSEEEINQSYLFENIKPNKFLKYKYLKPFGKKYIISFVDEKYISSFEKYGFVLIKKI